VRDLARAISFYRLRFGFALDWQWENQLAGISRDHARLFLHQESKAEFNPLCLWLNLETTGEVDELHQAWSDAGVAITASPEQKPCGLYEFTAEDADGKHLPGFLRRGDAAPTPERANLTFAVAGSRVAPCLVQCRESE